MTREPSVEKLILVNAHLVRCASDKRPLDRGWQRRPLSLAAAQRHVSEGLPIGIIPSSVGLLVIDVDPKLPLRARQVWKSSGLVPIGRDAAVTAVGKPICSIQTQSGGAHLVYHGPSKPVSNTMWRYGDIRHARGFVIAWDVAALVDAVRGRDQHAVVDVSRLPKKWPAGFGPALVALTGEGARSNTLNEEAFKDARHGCLSPDAEAAYHLAGETCGLPVRDVAATIASARNGGMRVAPEPNANHRPALENARLGKPERPNSEDPAPIRAEIDIACGFAVAMSDSLRCQTDAGRWLCWTDAEGWRGLETVILDTEIAMWGRANVVTKDGNPAPHVGGKRTTAVGARSLAGGLPGIATSARDWDAVQDLVGVPGGEVLEMGPDGVRRRRQQRADLVTRRLVTAPGQVEGSRWRKFLDEAVPDLAVRSYLQRHLGYALTGRGGEDRALFIYGPGGTGKGCFMDAVRAAFHEYAVTMPATHLMMESVRAHETNIARLHGSRLITCTEIARGARLNEALFNDITGGGTLSGRFMRKDGFEFQLNSLLVMGGNHGPQLKSRDTGVVRRIRVVPFNTLPAHKDEMLRSRLQRDPCEQAAVLRWICDGATSYLADGLGRDPAVVRVATAKYLSQVDVVSAFVSERVVIDPGVTTPQKHVGDAWTDWCEAGGILRPMPARDLYRTLEEDHGFRRCRPGGIKSFSGVTLEDDGCAFRA